MASRVGQSASKISSVSHVAKKLSATALSQQSPFLVMLAPFVGREQRSVLRTRVLTAAIG